MKARSDRYVRKPDNKYKNFKKINEKVLKKWLTSHMIIYITKMRYKI
ncbi:hypothetical protein AB434_1613 [Heyndrickxia coagulans]|uniref:Uncharacterized protein n=1 Tax=Heyndrickxia coagulans TaxID=1398 RepID=A0A0C5CFT6_HEYCO|nr:hypothetical protein SB48_HM08orf05933 [Heyndrickxia coagulans]AKN54018.1 hypothetical protein AB434_1613 [Heyndrickxia coagulans]KWZ76520.1 hypothetical protein HMPREF3213_03770 [Heyndrickxia coagulans]KYC67440.1 hypothetical protein B4100_1001 [Heyndrickxia coagulans]